jgi:hypothetical protein
MYPESNTLPEQPCPAEPKVRRGMVDFEALQVKPLYNVYNEINQVVAETKFPMAAIPANPAGRTWGFPGLCLPVVYS